MIDQHVMVFRKGSAALASHLNQSLPVILGIRGFDKPIHRWDPQRDIKSARFKQARAWLQEHYGTPMLLGPLAGMDHLSIRVDPLAKWTLVGRGRFRTTEEVAMMARLSLDLFETHDIK